MNDQSKHRKSMELFSQFCDGVMTNEEARHLDQLLRNDESSKDQFIDYLKLHTDLSLLEGFTHTGKDTPLGMLLATLLAEDVTRLLTDEVPTHSSLSSASRNQQGSLQGEYTVQTSTFHARIRSVVDTMRWQSVWVLAASVACIVTLGTLLMFTGEREVPTVAARNDNVDTRDSLPREAADTVGAVGEITRKIDCVWDDDRWHVAQGPTLRRGQTVQLTKGLMELSLRSGATLLLEGPASLTIESEMLVFLHQGKASATVPESAHGFTIRTPTCESIDLGTEFGLKVDPAGNSELHVFDGEVLAQKLGRFGRKVGDELQLDAGMASRFDRSTDETVTSSIPFSLESFSKLAFSNEAKSVQKPPVTKELVLWLSAQLSIQRDEQGRVAAWGDVLAGDNKESNNAWQVDQNRRPTWESSAINGHPAIRFDGQSFLVTEPFRTGEDQTVLVVFQPSSGQPTSKPPEGYGYQILNSYGPPNVVIERQPNYGLVSRVFAGYHDGTYESVGQIRSREIVREGRSYVCSYTYSASNNLAELRLNDVVQGREPAPIPARVEKPRIIGRHPAGSGYFYGDIAELMIYSCALSERELQTMSTHLMAKYNINREEHEN